MYLTGATLFLSLILSRVFYIILDFITVQEQYTALQTKSAKSSGNAGESDELRKRIRALEAELGKSQSTDRDFGTSLSGCFLNTPSHVLSAYRYPFSLSEASERTADLQKP